MASPLAATPSSSKFKLFSFSRTKLPGGAYDASNEDRSPPLRREASRSPLWQTNLSEGSSSQATICTEQGSAQNTSNSTRVRPLPQPPTRARSPRTSSSEEPSMLPCVKDPIFTPGLCTTPPLRDPRSVDSEVGRSRRSGDGYGPERDTAKRSPLRQPREQSPRSRTGATSPNMRQHETAYLASDAALLSPYHPREADRSGDSPAEENEIDIEDYPWFICRIIAGVDVKMDLKTQRGNYWP